jgi:SAM-dependent methyltransferase
MPSRSIAWRSDERPCPVCDTDERRFLGFRGGQCHHAQAGVATGIVRCRRCHLVYQRPFLLPDGNPYDAHADTYFSGHDSTAKRQRGCNLAGTAADILGRPGRALELGCGRGETLLGVRDGGWVVKGVDMTAPWAAAALDVDVEVSPLEAADSLNGTYELVILAAILEHLYDPRNCLARVHRALVPGGLVFIDVPNECGLWTRLGNAYMRLRGRNWAVNLSPSFAPFHVVGFCPASIAAVLSFTGFSILTLTHYAMRNALPRRPGFWPAVEGTTAGAVLAAAPRIGMGSGLVVWARRT